MQDAIITCAKSLGFDAVGFTTPDLTTDIQQGLHDFLAAGCHGDMGWMEANADKRADPKALWPEVASVIMVGHNYAPGFNPMEKLAHKDNGVISAYALNDDYHDVMKKKLKALARWIAETYACEVKVFVDTAPVMEKALAAKAGLGWQGKHTCLVSREFGSWLFLGCVFLSIPAQNLNSGRGPAGIEHQTPQQVRGSCGSCTRCLDICPTNAFTGEGKLDARKCIAYLTIEHKGQIPLEFRKAIGNRIYGCDDCLAVCPWNKFAQTSHEMAYHPREGLESPQLHDLLALDDAAFRTLFAKSPVKRLGRDRFIRNVLVAAGNSGNPSLIPAITPLLKDHSALVTEMAVWALEQIAVGS